MSVGRCGDPDCPIPEPAPTVLRRLSTHVLHAGTVLRRGHKLDQRDPTRLTPGLGDTRFAPLDGVAHAYLATTSFAALLESALHEAAPPAPLAYGAAVALWMESAVRLRHDVRLIDLRDGQLDRLGLDRAQLVSSTPRHYPCTRRWAEELHGRHVGGQPTHGLLWHSRQRELHHRALDARPALQDLVGEIPAEVAVVWAPPADDRLLDRADGSLGPLADGAGHAYVQDITALLQIVFVP